MCRLIPYRPISLISVGKIHLIAEWLRFQAKGVDIAVTIILLLLRKKKAVYRMEWVKNKHPLQVNYLKFLKNMLIFDYL